MIYEGSFANRFMNMPSQKSTASEAAAREPRRERGRLRVAALMQAGAAVFAERGFEAATMTAIATQARASIGSLYQFFPNKEALADALLTRYYEHVQAGLDAIVRALPTLSPAALADALIEMLVALQDERAAALVLIDARRKALGRPPGLIRQAIAEILTAASPALSPDRAAAMAIAVLAQMKAAAALSAEASPQAQAALQELRRMARLYLADSLA